MSGPIFSPASSPAARLASRTAATTRSARVSTSSGSTAFGSMVSAVQLARAGDGRRDQPAAGRAGDLGRGELGLGGLQLLLHLLRLLHQLLHVRLAAEPTADAAPRLLRRRAARPSRRGAAAATAALRVRVVGCAKLALRVGGWLAVFRPRAFSRRGLRVTPAQPARRPRRDARPSRSPTPPGLRRVRRHRRPPVGHGAAARGTDAAPPGPARWSCSTPDTTATPRTRRHHRLVPYGHGGQGVRHDRHRDERGYPEHAFNWDVALRRRGRSCRRTGCGWS